MSVSARIKYLSHKASPWNNSKGPLLSSSTRALHHGVRQSNQKEGLYPVAGSDDTNVSKNGLSALPLRMLLRSLLIATISSRRYLLVPSLSVLSFLSKPGRGLLLNVDKNPFIHALLKRTFYDQFCAGESEREAKATCRHIKDLGFRGVLLTFAKETVFDHRTLTEHSVGESALESKETGAPLDPKVAQNADIEIWRQGTLQTIDLLGETDYLAVK
jgi:hypothetical protein